MQCYLEIWTVHPKRLLLATFGGESDEDENMGETARCDAAWQALEFLYFFAGFAPSAGSKVDDELREDGK